MGVLRNYKPLILSAYSYNSAKGPCEDQFKEGAVVWKYFCLCSGLIWVQGKCQNCSWPTPGPGHGCARVLCSEGDSGSRTQIPLSSGVPPLPQVPTDQEVALEGGICRRNLHTTAAVPDWYRHWASPRAAPAQCCRVLLYGKLGSAEDSSSGTRVPSSSASSWTAGDTKLEAGASREQALEGGNGKPSAQSSATPSSPHSCSLQCGAGTGQEHLWDFSCASWR